MIGKGPTNCGQPWCPHADRGEAIFNVTTRVADRIIPVSLSKGDTLTLNEAAVLAGVSPSTIARWCKRYGIGRQFAVNSPWRVSGPALRMVIAFDQLALEAFRSGDYDAPEIASYWPPAIDRAA